MPSLRRGTLPVITLILVIAWALAAVYMLTRTITAAQDIDNRVAVINNRLPGIDMDTDAVQLARRTMGLTDQIRQQTQPLSPLLADTTGSVKSIDGTAKEILSTAREINGKAGSINDSVRAINGSARSINDTVGSINANVNSIGSRFDAVETAVNSIQGSVNSIGRSFVGILGESRSIQTGVAGINCRANVVSDIVVAIRGDTQPVDGLVGDIDGNAEKISNSPLLLQEPGQDVVQTVTSLVQQAGPLGPQDTSASLSSLVVPRLGASGPSLGAAVQDPPQGSTPGPSDASSASPAAAEPPQTAGCPGLGGPAPGGGLRP